MLGHVVLSYFKIKGFKVDTLDLKWPDENFKLKIKNSEADVLINCIGIIPQKNPKLNDYLTINIMLPIWLADNFNGLIIHPSTDCEFNGNIEENGFYSKKTIRNAEDNYGSSKAYGSLFLEKNYKNVKQIRTSIVGPEKNSNFSLWNWFVNNERQIIDGFTNVFWNGITTLQWAEICEFIIENPENFENVIQVGSEKLSKYQLLSKFNNFLHLNKKINPVLNKKNINKCLESDINLPSLDMQILSMIYFKKKYL